MATYLELKSQAEKLLAEAEELRKQELAVVVAEIKQKMEAYGITPGDLGFISFKPLPIKTGANKRAAPAGPVYQGPEGQRWQAGRGRKPRWLEAALSQGRKLEEFQVSA